MNTKTITTIIIATATAALPLSLTSCAGSAGVGASASAGVKPYPKDTCIVTGNKLGSMGDPITMVHEGQEVKFCCKPCVAKFKANPDKYLSKL